MNSSWMRVTRPLVCLTFPHLTHSLWHEERKTHKTFIVNQATVCVCVCDSRRSVCGVFPSWMSQQCRCMFPCTPLPCTGETWSRSPSLIFTATCTAERKPGLCMCVCICVVCLQAWECVCECVCGRWLWDVEGQVEKWMYRLGVWQPGVSVKLTVTVYGRAAWTDQQLINWQYRNTFWCKWQAKRSDLVDLHVWTCARAVLTVKVTVSLGEGVLQVGAELMNGGFQVCAALLTQFLLHLQSTAGETLRTHLQMISWKRQRKL